METPRPTHVGLDDGGRVMLVVEFPVPKYGISKGFLCLLIDLICIIVRCVRYGGPARGQAVRNEPTDTAGLRASVGDGEECHRGEAVRIPLRKHGQQPGAPGRADGRSETTRADVRMCAEPECSSPVMSDARDPIDALRVEQLDNVAAHCVHRVGREVMGLGRVAVSEQIGDNEAIST